MTYYTYRDPQPEADEPVIVPATPEDDNDELEVVPEVEGADWGPPPHVSAAALAIDRQATARMRCGFCGGRGLRLEPLHRGPVYVAQARCPRCLKAEEV